MKAVRFLETAMGASKGSTHPLLLLGTGSLLALGTLLTPVLIPAAEARPWGGQGMAAPETVYDSNPETWNQAEDTRTRGCGLGTLVGGLIGGGVGYRLSRQEGRSWAIPLGALVGSRMGCNLGAGRGPLPW